MLENDKPVFFPEKPFKQEIINALASARIGDGYEATGIMAQGAGNSYAKCSEEEMRTFLKECDIDFEDFFNS